VLIETSQIRARKMSSGKIRKLKISDEKPSVSVKNDSIN
jgi:hypothetical protein